MSKNNTTKRTITIADEKVVVVAEDIPIGQVKLDADNPRIREDLKKRPKALGAPTAEELQKLILGLSGVDALLKSIRDNRGLHESIYIRHNDVVAEGNCRTAIYRKLHGANKSDPAWQKISALRLPPHVTEQQIAILQGHMHVAGKITWRKHEQAGHLYTMHKTYHMSASAIAKALGMREKAVERLISSYQMNLEVIHALGKDDKGDGRKKFSTIDELFKVRDMEEWRSKPANLKTFKTLIIDGKLKRGVDVRKLSKIVDDPKALNVLKKDGFDKAIQIVGKKDPTADAPIFRKLKDTAAALQKVASPMIDRLRNGNGEQAIVKELFDAVKQFADTAGMKL